MLWAIYCTNKPGVAKLREEHRRAHRDHLDASERSNILFFAGGLQQDESTDSLGSLFIVKASSRAEAQAFIDAEGFHRGGVFQKVEITRIVKGRLHPGIAEERPAP